MGAGFQGEPHYVDEQAQKVQGGEGEMGREERARESRPPSGLWCPRSWHGASVELHGRLTLPLVPWLESAARHTCTKHRRMQVQRCNGEAGGSSLHRQRH